MEAANSKPMEELKQLALKWADAIVSNDAEAINYFMSDEWVIVGTEGGITVKERFLDFIRSGDLMHTRMDSDEMRVRLYENTGVLTSCGTSAGTYKEQPFSYYEWSTDIFVMENGQWKCVLTMLTPAKQ